MYPKFTKQETFDIVAKHLLKQGKRSTGDEGCLYRGPKGLKCAAGALIPDEDYTIQMDQGYDTAISGLHSRYGFSDWYGHDMEFVALLQRVHDNGIPSKWAESLKAIARQYRLSVNFAD